MLTTDEIQAKLKEKFGTQRSDYFTELKATRKERIFINVSSMQLREVIIYLKETFAMTHITTITAIDVGENIELLYHFYVSGITISLRVAVPKSNPVVETITPIIPGAILYEREIQDLLSVKVNAHPDPRRLILPEDWPDGVYPLRKSFNKAELTNEKQK